VIRRFFLIVSLFYCILRLPQQIYAVSQDEITSFHSDIVINQDTSLSITETIEYATTLQKHGIYRYIPISYSREGQKEVLPIRDITVRDTAGEKLTFTKSGDGVFLTLKIGDTDVTFTGSKKYVIHYLVDRGVRQFTDHAELYWDITGEGWQIPVLHSSATVSSSFASITSVACFSGRFGSDDGLCEQKSEPSLANFVYPKTISYGDNFTVLLSLPKESGLQFPSQTGLILLWIRYNWALLLTPLPILLMSIWWFRSGRDWQFISPNVFLLDPDQPKQRRPIALFAREPFVYEPLKQLSPGEAGALLDEKADIRDVLAELLELARKKYIKITALETKQFFGKRREFEFKQLAASDEGLSGAQKLLFKGLFAKNDTETTSSLKGSFYTTILAAKAELDASLVAKQCYVNNPNSVRAKGMVLLALSLFSVGFAVVTTLFTVGIYWPIVLLVLQLPFGFLFAYNLPQKTAIGTNLWLQARGLRKSIKYGKWREEIKEKNLFIEEILPFAVSLGVIKKLVGDMRELNLQPPEYLLGAQALGWSTTDWMDSFTQDAGSSLSYNPSSSSSSGSGGGGSSGGGGGGGGGGSW